MNNHHLKQRQLWLGIVISALCLITIFWYVDPRNFWQVLRTTNYLYLIPFILCLLAFLGFRAIRWRLLLQHKLSLTEVFHIQSIGYMLNMLLPFRLGEIGRVMLASNNPHLSVLQTGSTIIAERLLDLLFFVTLFPFAIAKLSTIPPEFQFAAQIVGFVAIIGTLVLVIAANQRLRVEKLTNRFSPSPKLTKLITDLLDGLHALNNWRDGSQLIFWSIVIWLPVFVAYDLIFRAVHLPIPLAAISLVICSAAFGVAAPSSPGQFGVFHAAVIFALTTLLGYPEATAASFAFIYHTVQYLFFILVGFIGLSAIDISWKNLLQQVRQPKTEKIV